MSVIITISMAIKLLAPSESIQLRLLPDSWWLFKKFNLSLLFAEKEDTYSLVCEAILQGVRAQNVTSGLQRSTDIWICNKEVSPGSPLSYCHLHYWRDKCPPTVLHMKSLNIIKQFMCMTCLNMFGARWKAKPFVIIMDNVYLSGTGLCGG